MTHAPNTQRLMPKLSISLNKLVLMICIFVVIYFGYERYEQHQFEQTEADVFILTPKVNDIYFLDLRLINNNQDLKNKYKLAKVVRVSDDNVAIIYGRFFYQWQYAVVNSIQYGDLSNSDYFTSIPDYISYNRLQEMKSNGAIYLVKRPMQNKIYGDFVSSE